MAPAIDLEDQLASVTSSNSRRFLLALGLCCTSLLVYTVGTVIHRLWFHPLSKFPGPWLNAVSDVSSLDPKETYPLTMYSFLPQYGSCEDDFPWKRGSYMRNTDQSYASARTNLLSIL